MKRDFPLETLNDVEWRFKVLFVYEGLSGRMSGDLEMLQFSLYILTLVENWVNKQGQKDKYPTRQSMKLRNLNLNLILP
jgi:hypothetical protein